MHRLQFNNKLIDDPQVTLFIHPFVPSDTFYCNIVTISSTFVDCSKTTLANLIVEIIATFFQLFEGNISKKQISILYMNSWRVSLFQYASTRGWHWSTKSRFWSVVQAEIATFDCFYSFFSDYITTTYILHNVYHSVLQEKKMRICTGTFSTLDVKEIWQIWLW